eukprot:COSAG02_NODE_2710_length_8187_cov_3.257295_2_plen_76_part_00
MYFESIGRAVSAHLRSNARSGLGDAQFTNCNPKVFVAVHGTCTEERASRTQRNNSISSGGRTVGLSDWPQLGRFS